MKVSPSILSMDFSNWEKEIERINKTDCEFIHLDVMDGKFVSNVTFDENFIKTWVSHTLYGFSWANERGFTQLARIIAAHHGRKDWGAIIDLDEKNIEPVLYLMHHIDDISAKFGITKIENI